MTNAEKLSPAMQAAIEFYGSTGKTTAYRGGSKATIAALVKRELIRMGSYAEGGSWVLTDAGRAHLPQMPIEATGRTVADLTEAVASAERMMTDLESRNSPLIPRHRRLMGKLTRDLARAIYAERMEAFRNAPAHEITYITIRCHKHGVSSTVGLYGKSAIECWPCHLDAQTEDTTTTPDTDAWGRPLMQPGDGHGAWECNNYECTQHPQSMYPNYGRDTTPDTTITPEVTDCTYCRRAIVRDERGTWRNAGDSAGGCDWNAGMHEPADADPDAERKHRQARHLAKETAYRRYVAAGAAHASACYRYGSGSNEAVAAKAAESAAWKTYEDLN